MNELMEGTGRLSMDPEPMRPRSFAPWHWLLTKLSKGASQARAWARHGKIRTSIRLIKSLFMSTIGKDRGFGFWWLVAMAAIALIIALLLAVLLSPVIGILAALAVAIWLLIRRNRSSRSRRTAQPHLAN